MSEDKKQILYVCPYCKRGRFTGDDGWDGAVRHIKLKHNRRGENARRKRPSLDNFDDNGPLLEEAAFS